MPKRIRFDARELEHPEPLEQALAHFNRLEGSEVLYMIHRKNPLPLFELIKKRAGFCYSFEDERGEWHIFITKDGTIDLKGLDV